MPDISIALVQGEETDYLNYANGIFTDDSNCATILFMNWGSFTALGVLYLVLHISLKERNCSA